MPFLVGDKVMHPQYGAGQITNIEHRELVQGFEHYFVVETVHPESTLYIPMRKMKELGVRPIMSPAKMAHVLDTLRGRPHQLSKDFKERQARIRAKISTGRSIKLAEAVRDLSYRGHYGRLTQVDQALLDRGRELLASEMALVTDSSLLDVEEKIQTALHIAMANKIA